MRIAVFIKSTTFNKGFGGLETQNKLLVEGLAGAGHRVMVCSPRPDSLSRHSEFISESDGSDMGEARQILKRVQDDEQIDWREDEQGFFRVTYNALRLTYYFIDAPSGKYSRQWFRESLKVFKKLHKESPFDVVISQSMAGQAIVAYLGKTRSAANSPELSFGDSSKLSSFPSPPVVVIQHGTILGELKTRWRALFLSNSVRARHSEGAGATEESRHCSSKEILRCAQNDRKLDQLLFFFLHLVPYCIKVYIQDQFRLRRADKVIAVSDQVRDALIREYFLPPGKVEVVYNGVEVERFVMRNALPVMRGELEISEDDKVLLYVGRVEKEKGLEVLFRAVSRIPPAAHRITHNAPALSKVEGYRIAVLIVGNGPYLADLKDLAERLRIADRVIFAGQVPYESVPKYYAAADVFVLPSLREEGLPMTLPEAMASGLLIVASRIGGIPAAVKDGETGLLVEPGSISELAETLSKILADDGLRSKMGRRARQVVEEKFSQEAMVEGTLCVISNLQFSIHQ